MCPKSKIIRELSSMHDQRAFDEKIGQLIIMDCTTKGDVGTADQM